MLFQLGQVVATPAAAKAMEENQTDLFKMLARHTSGDWGICHPDDAADNLLSVEKGFRIMSVYLLADYRKVWVITEADRSSTCILLPDEY
jgi:hypothetical protein